MDVAFFRVDISDPDAVAAAFKAPWPGSEGQEETTIFHTAANIRFYERHPDLVHRSAVVNVNGTGNIIRSARSIGASALIYTSSGSVALRRSRFWLWPWEAEPPHFVQIMGDDDKILPRAHEEFFSNYAVTKLQAEKMVREADGSASGKGIMKTGCLRPGNGVYGPGGDILCGAYLVRKNNPTWIPNIMQSFLYVENCSGEIGSAEATFQFIA